MDNGSHLKAGNRYQDKFTPYGNLEGNNIAGHYAFFAEIGCNFRCSLIHLPVGVAKPPIIHHILPVRILFYGSLPAVQQGFIAPVALLQIHFLLFWINFKIFNHKPIPGVWPLTPSLRPEPPRINPLRYSNRRLQRLVPFHPY